MHQAAVLKDVLVQKAIDVKDATVGALKELTTPSEEQAKAVHYNHGTTTTVAEKKPEQINKDG